MNAKVPYAEKDTKHMIETEPKINGIRREQREEILGARDAKRGMGKLDSVTGMVPGKGSRDKRRYKFIDRLRTRRSPCPPTQQSKTPDHEEAA